MTRPHVLIGNAPRSYREAIAGTIQHLRPGITVATVEPEEVEAAVHHGAPEIVICSELPSTQASEVFAWIILYPGGLPCAIVFSHDRVWTIPDVQFDVLLSTIDRCLGLAHMS